MKKLMYTFTFMSIFQCILINSNHVNAKNITNFKNGKYLLKNIKPDISGLLSSNRHNNDREKEFQNSLDAFLLHWSVIDGNKNYEVTKDPYTIFIPKLDDRYTVQKDNAEEFIFEHLVPGIAFKAFTENEYYGNLNKNRVGFAKIINNSNSGDINWFVNKVKISKLEIISPTKSVVFIDGYLGDNTKNFLVKKTNHRSDGHPQSSVSQQHHKESSQYAVQSNGQKMFHDKDKEEIKRENKVKYLINFLSTMKLGTKVFQHFLNKSSLAIDFNDNYHYTILIPIDNAFQRWHPIDWGFYPFSVQEFTERVLQNHFIQLKVPFRMDDFKNLNQDKEYTTLGGETVVFRKHPAPNVNNVSILSDHTLSNGNEIFLISEVLFVSEAIVSRLHQLHKDKETPPLLAFPWFGAQFLSHAFLALERDSRFAQITRFLNTAEIAQFVSGANYTFFVPIDSAFEKLNYNNLTDDALNSETITKMLLNHFVKGRYYERDLKDDEIFETLNGGYLKIRRPENGNITINNAHIIESEIFVYNLGTMFFIDAILYGDILSAISTVPTSTIGGTQTTLHGRDNKELGFTTIVDPMSFDDGLFQDDGIETETPKALPLNSPK